ncbi:Predicted small secreted protein [Methylobacillus rhizosphaerae]|uniref:Predicted small secreted protein n=1 Tax=Methylobacillus rhizosphaerae TaxID=551994 RepID=A0A238YH40_9PROT|nr:entericidin A/B family lipoprotein [Methylobacillus rhizosphaerae]SNR70390.1 Predicted small secreted protein [Methylobacillus rhizosphaerae]
MTRITMLLLFALSAMTLAACNTIHGVGKDIEQAGEAIQKSTQ